MTNARVWLRTQYLRLPSAVRSGWVTGWVAFVGALITIAAGLLPELANAVSSRNFEPFFDRLSIASNAAVSAAFGFVAGCVNTLYRAVRPIARAYPEVPRS